MLKVYLVRHGQTDFSAENRFCGSLDPSLNQNGLKMAEAFGLAYEKLSWEAIYTSPSLRARQTAQALATRVGKELMLNEGLRELSYGAWEGKSHDEVKQQDPDAYAYWAADSTSRSAPGGEIAFQVAARAVPVLDQILEKHKQGNVLIVSHKTTLRILICSQLGLDVRVYRDRIAQPVTAVSCIEYRPRGPLLVKLGDVAHLSAELQALPGT